MLGGVAKKVFLFKFNFSSSSNDAVISVLFWGNIFSNMCRVR